jgi:predicted DNA-binding transcriptional regulator AlpA
VSADPRYLDQQAVAAYLMISRAMVGQLVERGKLPPPVELTPRLKRWDRQAIDAALASGAAGPLRPSLDSATRGIVDDIVTAQRRPARHEAPRRRHDRPSLLLAPRPGKASES